MKFSVKVFLCSIILIALFASCAKPGHPLTAAELLDLLGERDLLELNYEQALVNFTMLIEVEPMNPRGYIGAAEAYVGLGDIDSAERILRQGLTQLPENAELQSLLDSLTPTQNNDLISEESENADEEELTEPPAWDSFTDEEKDMLNRLEAAADAFDYEAAHELMTSTVFLDFFYEQVEISEGEDEHGNYHSGHFVYKHNEGISWQLYYWQGFYEETHGSKDFMFDRWDPNGVSVGILLWIHENGHQSISISHRTFVDGMMNGAFETLSFGSPGNELTRFEGTAVDNSPHGTEIITDMITGEHFIFQWEHGWLTNSINENGSAYILGSNGGRWYADDNHVMWTTPFH